MSLPLIPTSRISPGFLPIVEQLAANSVLYFGKPVSRIEPTTEVCGRFSHVLRLRIEAADHVSAIYVKRYEPRTGTPEEALRFRRYVVTEYSRTLLAGQCSTPSAGVARAIACLPEHFALVTEEAKGAGLDRLLWRAAIVRTPAARGNVYRALSEVAGWLRRFQTGVPVVKTRMRDYRRYLDIRLRELVNLKRTGFGEAERTAALAFFDMHHARLAPADETIVPIHGDLCPSNILVRDDGVTVLDLAMSGDGTRYQDLAHVWFHVALSGRRLWLGTGVVEGWKRALLQAYEQGLTPDAPLFRIMLLQHAVCFLAHVATEESVIPGSLEELRWRRRVAWCLDLTGISVAPGGRFPATVWGRSARAHGLAGGERRTGYIPGAID